MGGEGRHRPVAARQLVCALGARLHPLEAARDGDVDRLVIAKLEMEEGDVLDGAPIAAVERLRADQIQSAGDRAAVAEREDQQHLFAQPLAEQREEGTSQIGLAPFARTRVLVESPEGVPMRLGDPRAGEVDDLQPLDCRRPLLADRLALARGERGEKVVEARMILIQPVELAVGADQPAGPLEQGHLFGGDEGGVGGGEAVLVDHLAGGADQGRGERGIAGQQPPAGDRRERHCDLQLGIIIAADLLERVRPGVIEHIFAQTMALHISGHHRRGPRIGSVDRDRQRLPAGRGRGAARFLQRREEGVAEERIVRAGAAIPVFRLEGGDAARQPREDGLAAHSAGTS